MSRSLDIAHLAAEAFDHHAKYGHHVNLHIKIGQVSLLASSTKKARFELYYSRSRKC